MDRDYLVDLYDDAYAASYEEKFLHSPVTRGDTAHEVELLRSFLDTKGTRWLDVACGTGYFLQQFPSVERTGIDISPAMLRRARDSNPDISLLQHDFRDPLPTLNDGWDLVSCMWYAYGLVDTISDLLKLIHNLWSWTSPTGMCFVPLADLALITGVDLPYEMPSMLSESSRIVITGILWSYIEEDGAHFHQLAPNLKFVTEQFDAYFEDVKRLVDEGKAGPRGKPFWVYSELEAEAEFERP